MDFFLNGDPGNVSNRGSSGSCLGRGRPAFSDAITLTDEFIACQVKAAGKPTGVRVEVAGAFGDGQVDRMDKGGEPVAIPRFVGRDARQLIPGGMWWHFEKFRSACPVRWSGWFLRGGRSVSSAAMSPSQGGFTPASCTVSVEPFREGKTSPWVWRTRSFVSFLYSVCLLYVIECFMETGHGCGRFSGVSFLIPGCTSFQF